jgi:phage-related protein
VLRYSEVIFGSLGGPKGARKEAGFQLGKVQAGLVPTDWKPFDDVGAGTRAIRIRDASGIYRGMRVAKFEEAVYVLHCFEKKTQWPASRTRTLLRRAIAQWSARGNEMKIDTEIPRDKAGSEPPPGTGSYAGRGPTSTGYVSQTDQ